MGFLPQDSSNTGFLPHRIPPKRDSSHVGFLLLDSSHGITPTLDSSHKGFLPQWMPPIQDSYKTRNFQHDYCFTGQDYSSRDSYFTIFIPNGTSSRLDFLHKFFPPRTPCAQDSFHLEILKHRIPLLWDSSRPRFQLTPSQKILLTWGQRLSEDSSHVGC